MKTLLVVVLLALVAGCASLGVNALSLTEKQYEPTAQVELVADEVGYPYESLALISGWCRRWISNEELLAAMKERARQLGATAIIRLDTYSRPSLVLQSGVVVSRGGLKGVAIRRLEE